MQNPATLVRDTIGRPMPLGLMESIASARVIDADTLAVSVNRAWVRERTNGDVNVYKRGLAMYLYHRQGDGRWIREQVAVQCWSINELHTSRRITRDREWEDLCHRPGTDSFPMDNLDRQAQGYTY